jgi:hypothetical protein
MNKHIGITAFIFTTLISCSIPKQATTPTVSKQTFTFDYAPKESAKLGSASMVLAFIKPEYATNFTLSSNELFGRFKTGLTGDIEELIISKGFTLKGPYESRDEMVFEDKKQIEMAISIEINPAFSSAVGEWKSRYHMNLLNAGNSYYSYSYSGKVSLTGKINVSGIEPLTNEKIWSKSVSIPNIENIQITTQNEYLSKQSESQLIEDPAVYNAIGRALQTQYAGIMDKIAVHFNVEELASLKSQIKELKSKKGF